jgi:hypothetical protein
MDGLNKNQSFLITDLKDDIQLYREEVESQIRKTKIMTYVGIGLAVVVGIVLFINPHWVESVQSLSENMGMITGFIGEVIPITLASKSFNSVKNQKKKLKGLRTFDKTIKRMELGLVSNTKNDILLLEEDFAEYIIT